MHRVGLTRHCLASGRIQLPFALSDAFPEGDLLAQDVDHDELILLESLPPRRLSGLRGYFERNELQVNDVLEFRLAEGELRLACVRRARRDLEEAREARTAAHAPDPRPAAEPADGGDAAGADRDRVIGRIGSVTVRRLGSGRFAPPPEAALRTPRHDGPTGRTSAPRIAGETPAPDAPAPADPPPAPDVPNAADAGATGPVGPRAAADPAPADPSRDDVLRDDAAHGGASRREAVDDLDALPDAAPVARAEAEHERVAEADLLDEDELHGRDRAGREAPVLRWFRRPAAAAAEAEAESRRSRRPEPSRSEPQRPEPRPAPRPEAVAPRVEERRADPVVGTARRALGASAARGGPEGGGSSATGDPGERQRAREEALSRAGDLRSRMVRWLLDPRTPVIVQHEHVQERFGLDASVARDVLAGILEDPPPSLRLTAVREDVVRVSRVTVQHEG